VSDPYENTPDLPRMTLDTIAARCPDKRIACAQALALARELGVSPMQIGKAANQLGLKIHSCQLGCFGWRKKPGT